MSWEEKLVYDIWAHNGYELLYSLSVKQYQVPAVCLAGQLGVIAKVQSKQCGSLMQTYIYTHTVELRH